MRQIEPDVNLPEPVYVSVPFVKRHDTKRTVYWREQPIILPHLLFAALRELYPRHFARTFGSENDARSFWEQVDITEPRLHGNVIHSIDDYASRCFPVIVHGDGAIYTHDQDSITTIQWSPLIKEGT
eukprot:1989363-Alexandrium_andersonii.AAC.1